jgi:RNA polymerase sigma factor (sigma-70 family)
MVDPGEASRTPRPSLAERIIASLPGLTRFVRRRMGPELAARESASDIVQSTCRELLRGAATFEDRGDASFQRWLQGAAEHKLQNRARHWRAERRQGDARSLDAGGPTDSGAHSIDPEAPSSARPSQDAMLREEAERLSRAFRALPPEYQRVLMRSQIDGKSHAEIAIEMGRTPEAVRKLVARAMARFSADLETDEGSDKSESSGRAPPA